MKTTRKQAPFAIACAAVLSAFMLHAASGCELLVNLDVGLVDSGGDSGACPLCVDGQVVYDEAGDPIAIIPLDSGAAADATAADAPVE